MGVRGGGKRQREVFGTRIFLKSTNFSPLPLFSSSTLAASLLLCSFLALSVLYACLSVSTDSQFSLFRLIARFGFPFERGILPVYRLHALGSSANDPTSRYTSEAALQSSYRLNSSESKRPLEPEHRLSGVLGRLAAPRLTRRPVLLHMSYNISVRD